jgi:hypothetical protein
MISEKVGETTRTGKERKEKRHCRRQVSGAKRWTTQEFGPCNTALSKDLITKQSLDMEEFPKRGSTDQIRSNVFLKQTAPLSGSLRLTNDICCKTFAVNDGNFGTAPCRAHGQCCMAPFCTSSYLPVPLSWSSTSLIATNGARKLCLFFSAIICRPQTKICSFDRERKRPHTWGNCQQIHKQHLKFARSLQITRIAFTKKRKISLEINCLQSIREGKETNNSL